MTFDSAGFNVCLNGAKIQPQIPYIESLFMCLPVLNFGFVIVDKQDTFTAELLNFLRKCMFERNIPG
jgi:hypothetical protein